MTMPPLWVVGATVTVAAVGIAYINGTYRRLVRYSSKLRLPLDVRSRWNSRAAGRYDRTVWFLELVMSMPQLRQRMANRLEGRVLETSVGTGRNFQYYPMGKIQSITALDYSPDMLEAAKRKFKEIHPSYGNITFLVQDAAISIQSSGSKVPKFDTIFQTMSLCSTPDPVEVLKALGTQCEQRGKILLLEHGRTRYEWMNNILDSLASAHAHRHGCWWNREVGDIVEDSGLEVVTVERYFFGALWWVELRPRG